MKKNKSKQLQEHIINTILANGNILLCTNNHTFFQQAISHGNENKLCLNDVRSHIIGTRDRPPTPSIIR